ncbi:ethanolamine ammonia-lyase light chain EutC [Methylococcus geothermalis]
MPRPAMRCTSLETSILSSTAVDRRGRPLLQAIARSYSDIGRRLEPIRLIANGRVALSDPIGAGLEARLSIIVVDAAP